MGESRLHKSLLNAKVSLLFYFVSLFLSFFSRKIFLDKLGDDFVGLTGTISNLLDFLNLAELGIGTAIGTVLYKPLFDKDKISINEIISVFGYFYRVIGCCILGVGLLLSSFLPLIFSDTMFQLPLIFFAYYSFLASSLIGYFVNYKQTLLGADQRNYVVTAYFQISNLVKAAVQMTLAWYTQNYYYWVAIELLFGIIYSLILNWKIRRVYPWLAADVKLGRQLRKKYPLIMTYAKQLFVHKIGSLVQFQMKPLLIYAFVSLKIVAFYGNYALIIDKLMQLIKSVLGSTSAGVGSLIAEGDQKRIQGVFEELIALNYYIAGLLTFTVYYLLEPFVALWLGPEYLLGKGVLILLLCNMFIMLTRGAVDQFLFGYGLFSDVWAPIAEAVISLSVSLIGGYFWGIEGVLLGSVVSMLLIVVCWKPLFLYRRGFCLPLFLYWKGVFKVLLFIGVTWVSVSCFIHYLILIHPSESYLNWMLFAVIIVSLYGALSFGLFYIGVEGMRVCVRRIMKKFFHK